MWFRQIAQLSTTISHAHRATAFHCLILVLSLKPSQEDSVYLLDLKTLLISRICAGTGLGCLGFGCRSISHSNVGHVRWSWAKGGGCLAEENTARTGTLAFTYKYTSVGEMCSLSVSNVRVYTGGSEAGRSRLRAAERSFLRWCLARARNGVPNAKTSTIGRTHVVRTAVKYLIQYLNFI